MYKHFRQWIWDRKNHVWICECVKSFTYHQSSPHGWQPSDETSLPGVPVFPDVWSRWGSTLRSPFLLLPECATHHWYPETKQQELMCTWSYLFLCLCSSCRVEKFVPCHYNHFSRVIQVFSPPFNSKNPNVSNNDKKWTNWIKDWIFSVRGRFPGW